MATHRLTHPPGTEALSWELPKERQDAILKDAMRHRAAKGLPPKLVSGSETSDRQLARYSAERDDRLQAVTFSDGPVSLSPDFVSQLLLDLLGAGKTTCRGFPQLRELQDMIPVIKAPHLQKLRRGLKKLDEGAESEVFLHEQTGLVYKILFKSPNMGRVGDGYAPGDIYSEGRVDTRPTYLVDYLERVAFNNAHAGQVLTEVVGITPEGQLVVVQAYIEGLVPSNHVALGMDLRAELQAGGNVGALAELERRRGALLRPLGLVTIDKATAVGWAKDTPIIAADLHDGNVMMAEGRAYVIDATTRQLTPQEIRLPVISRALAHARNGSASNGRLRTSRALRRSDQSPLPARASMAMALQEARALMVSGTSGTELSAMNGFEQPPLGDVTGTPCAIAAAAAAQAKVTTPQSERTQNSQGFTCPLPSWIDLIRERSMKMYRAACEAAGQLSAVPEGKG